MGVIYKREGRLVVVGSLQVGSKVEIHSYKHDGSIHRMWETSLVLHNAEDTLIVANDRTQVTESNGRNWITEEPAICHFYSEYWFNIIGLIRDVGIVYYCNISSPYEYNNGILSYIDYDLDVLVSPDGTYQVLDKEEYENHKQMMNYPEKLDQTLQKNLNTLIQWIEQQKGPFTPERTATWYEHYVAIR